MLLIGVVLDDFLELNSILDLAEEDGGRSLLDEGYSETLILPALLLSD